MKGIAVKKIIAFAFFENQFYVPAIGKLYLQRLSEGQCNVNLCTNYLYLTRFQIKLVPLLQTIPSLHRHRVMINVTRFSY